MPPSIPYPKKNERSNLRLRKGGVVSMTKLIISAIAMMTLLVLIRRIFGPIRAPKRYRGNDWFGK
jgi:hypothetical protein